MRTVSDLLLKGFNNKSLRVQSYFLGKILSILKKKQFSNTQKGNNLINFIL